MADKPAPPGTDDLVHGVPPIAVSTTSTLVNKTGSWKYIRPVYRDRVAPCNEGCPVGIDIEGYMSLLREGKVAEAVDLLLRENPMPATTGRVCDHPCEKSCNRRLFDEAVSIHAVERMLGDLAHEAPPPPAPPRTRKERVAVIGSGPAGLSSAWHLARLGYGVTIFEAAPEPGGMLRLGIPEYRLPREVLDREIERVRAAGVEILCDQRVGSSVSWREVERYDAIFLAPGLQSGRPLGIPGEGDGAIRGGLEFLREVNAGGRPRLGRRVIVVGGGNTAIDCARTALRLGSSPVILYRRSREEMPAIASEVEDAEREGIEFEFLAAPVQVRARGGKVTGLECLRMRLGEPDASGRRSPVPIEGSRFFLGADTILTAIGEEAAADSAPPGLARDGWLVKVDGFGGAGLSGIFAGGDIVAQPHSVAHALGSGKRAALGIDRYLRAAAGESVPGDDIGALRYGPGGNLSATRWRCDDPIVRHGAVNEVVRFESLNTNHFAHAGRHQDRHLAVAFGQSGFGEVNQGLAHSLALREAARCFNCGVCNGCEVCMIFCPDVAVSRRADGRGFDIAYEYCKGCGICNAECPRGAMSMTREGL